MANRVQVAITGGRLGHLLHGALIKGLSENEHRPKHVRTTGTKRTTGNTKSINNDGTNGKKQVQNPNSIRSRDRLDKNQPKNVMGADIRIY